MDFLATMTRACLYATLIAPLYLYLAVAQPMFGRPYLGALPAIHGQHFGRFGNVNPFYSPHYVPFYRPGLNYFYNGINRQYYMGSLSYPGITGNPVHRFPTIPAPRRRNYRQQFFKKTTGVKNNPLPKVVTRRPSGYKKPRVPENVSNVFPYPVSSRAHHGFKKRSRMKAVARAKNFFGLMKGTALGKRF